MPDPKDADQLTRRYLPPWKLAAFTIDGQRTQFRHLGPLESGTWRRLASIGPVSDDWTQFIRIHSAQWMC